MRYIYPQICEKQQSKHPKYNSRIDAHFSATQILGNIVESAYYSHQNSNGANRGTIIDVVQNLELTVTVLLHHITVAVLMGTVVLQQDTVYVRDAWISSGISSRMLHVRKVKRIETMQMTFYMSFFFQQSIYETSFFMQLKPIPESICVVRLSVDAYQKREGYFKRFISQLLFTPQ